MHEPMLHENCACHIKAFSPTDFYKLRWSGRIGRPHRGQRFPMFSLHLEW